MKDPDYRNGKFDRNAMVMFGNVEDEMVAKADSISIDVIEGGVF